MDISQTVSLGSKTDKKIFILFLLDAVDCPLNYSMIHHVMRESGYIGDFDFAECFSELCEHAHVINVGGDEDPYYVVSETGKAVARELQGDIMQSIRDKSSQVATRYVALLKQGLTVKASIAEDENGRSVVNAELRDTSGVMMSFSLRTASRKEAERVRDNFKERPDIIYKAFLSMSTGDINYFM